MSENGDSKEAPKSAKSIIDYIKENITVVVLGFLGVGGTGTGIGFGDVMYQTALTKVVNDLDSLHNIRPLPPHLDDMSDMIIEAVKYRNQTDSILNFHNNFINYQIGFNNNIAFNNNKVDTVCDQIPMQYDVVDKTFHVEYNGYVYTAVPQGKGRWAIYLFNWQIPLGTDNYKELEPVYYNFDKWLLNE
jgi:hypothetical protein